MHLLPIKIITHIHFCVVEEIVHTWPKNNYIFITFIFVSVVRGCLMTSGSWRALHQMPMVTHLLERVALQTSTSLPSMVSSCSLVGVCFFKQAPLLHATSDMFRMHGGLRCIAVFRYAQIHMWIGTFSFEYEYEIEYEYEFLISNNSPPLNPNLSLLLTSRSGDCRNKIDVTSDHLKHANKIWKVVLVLNLVLVLKSKGLQYYHQENHPNKEW